MRILVLDGHEPSRLLAQCLLVASGHEVTCVTTIDDALMQAHARRYDVLVADVLPGVPRGPDILARIARGAALDGTTLIAVTSLAMKGDRERILEAGFHAYISKPIDPEVFAEDVERIRSVSRGKLNAAKLP